MESISLSFPFLRILQRILAFAVFVSQVCSICVGVSLLKFHYINGFAIHRYHFGVTLRTKSYNLILSALINVL